MRVFTNHVIAMPATILDALSDFNLMIGWWPEKLMNLYYENASWIKFCFFLFVFLEIVNFGFFRWFKYYVKTRGPIYKSIERINSRYSFFPLAREYTFFPSFNSVAQLRAFNIEKYSVNQLKNSNSQLHAIVNSARINGLRYEKYIDELSQINAEYVSSGWGTIARFFLLKYEKEIYQKLQHNPVKAPAYFFELNYTSPQGRNSYSKTIEVKHRYFERLYNSLFPRTVQPDIGMHVNQSVSNMLKSEKMSSSEIHFNKFTSGYLHDQNTQSVSPSKTPKKTVSAKPQTDKPIDIKPGLRYEILERDKGKCRVCGKSKKDNVKLEVMPIRIYGPPTERNLHTICNECFATQQRKLCTDRVKEAVKRRDGYACQICGNTEADGYTLHVDHKRAVARWGMSTHDNLWTLCQNCNLGKGKKYNPIEMD